MSSLHSLLSGPDRTYLLVLLAILAVMATGFFLLWLRLKDSNIYDCFETFDAIKIPPNKTVRLCRPKLSIPHRLAARKAKKAGYRPITEDEAHALLKKLEGEQKPGEAIEVVGVDNAGVPRIFSLHADETAQRPDIKIMTFIGLILDDNSIAAAL